MTRNKKEKTASPMPKSMGESMSRKIQNQALQAVSNKGAPLCQHKISSHHSSSSQDGPETTAMSCLGIISTQGALSVEKRSHGHKMPLKRQKDHKSASVVSAQASQKGSNAERITETDTRSARGHRVGGDSNTPLPGATCRQNVVCLKPILDTLGLSVNTALSDDFLKLEKACNVTNDSIETLNWKIRRGRLNGYSSYTHVATGQGKWSGVQISIGPSREFTENPSIRAIRVDIGSHICWHHATHGGNAYTVARATMASLVGEVLQSRLEDIQINVRRVDVCVDHWGTQWKITDLENFACRQKGRGVNISHKEQKPSDAWVYKAASGFTLYVGRRGAAARFLRIYDKTAEAAKTGKLTWLEPLWQQVGWDGKQTVWRAEIEHGGEWLRQHGLETIDKLKGCERELWKHYTQSVRHTVGNKTRNKRAESSLAWRCLSVAARFADHGIWRWQPRPPTSETDTTALLKQATGCMRNAAEGLAVRLLLPGSDAPWDNSKHGSDLRRQQIYELVDKIWDEAEAKNTSTCSGLE